MDMSPSPVDSLARYAREITHDGKDLVEFCRRMARGEPFPQKKTRIRLLKKPLKNGQLHKVIIVETTYYPTARDRKWAAEQLARRGWA